MSKAKSTTYGLKNSKDSKKQTDSKKQKEYDTNIFERIGKAVKSGYKSKKEKLWEYQQIKKDNKTLKTENLIYRAKEKKDESRKSYREKFGPTLSEIMDKQEDAKIDGSEIPESYLNKGVKEIMKDISRAQNRYETMQQRDTRKLETIKSKAKKASKERREIENRIFKIGEEGRDTDIMTEAELSYTLEDTKIREMMYTSTMYDLAKKNRSTNHLLLNIEMAYDNLEQMYSAYKSGNKLTPEEERKLVLKIGETLGGMNTYDIDVTGYLQKIEPKAEEMKRHIDDVFSRVRKEQKSKHGEADEEIDEEA